MAQVSLKFRSVQNGGLMHWCEGCQEMHVAWVGQGSGPRWDFNGDLERPTFKPSFLLRTGHYAEGKEQASDEHPCWCNYEKRLGTEAPFKCVRCHTFITDGQVQFLSDSTHQLSGQTRPLPDLPEDERD